MSQKGTQRRLQRLPEHAERRLTARRYARVANKPYSLNTANETDFETHFTVVRYHDDQAVAASQVRAQPSSLLGPVCYPTTGWLGGPVTDHSMEELLC